MSAPSSPQQKALELFDTWVELAEPERQTRLALLQAQDAAVAAALRELLRADAEASGMLDRGVQAIVADVVEPGVVPMQEAPSQVGAFKLLRPLGRGGMGEVWLAERRDGAFVQQVALKLLKRGMDSDAVIARFVQERRILAELNHPHIARFIDGGISADARPYFAMEYVAGENLIDHANAQQLGVRERVRLLATICDAVAYAQAHLVVHRDLKPSNILIDDSSQPRVLDFGIAKLLGDSAPEETMTQTGARALSPQYAAPEQVLGESISTATDVYALGTILFELLTGTLPQQRQSLPLEALAAQVKSEQTTAPSAVLRRNINSAHTNGTTQGSHTARVAREVTGDLDTIVLTALQREPARRYANAAALAEDLRRWLDARPIAAQADTRGYRLRKFVARNRLAVGSASAVLLALLAGLSVALWQTKVAREQAARAETELRRAESIKEFALSLFREQDPLARGKPEARSASELIALGVERARTQFADDLAQRSQLLNDLGEIQNSLGEYEAATPVLEQALRERTALYGPNSIEHAGVQANFATAKMGLGQGQSALKLLEASASTMSKQAGPESPDTLKVRARLVQALTQVGRVDEAMTLARALLPVHERVLGPDAPQTIALLAENVSQLEQNGSWDEAEASSQLLIERIERVHGAQSILLIRPLGIRGDILRVRQKYREADPYYERAIALGRLNKSAPLTARVLMRRGDLLRRTGQTKEAEALIDEALALLPPASPDRAQGEVLRAVMLRKRGEFTQAAAGFLSGHQTFLAALGADSVFPWIAAVQFADTQRKAGRGAEAEPLLLEAVANLKRITKPQSPEIMEATAALADWRAEQGRRSEAAALYIEVVALCESIYGPGHVNTLTGYLAQAANLIAIGDADSLVVARKNVQTVLASDTKETRLSEEIRIEANRLLALTNPSARR
jgi:eukaryotic-like serine/threonine-protein kinase